jgi:excisionase family DNA binding protein
LGPPVLQIPPQPAAEAKPRPEPKEYMGLKEAAKYISMSLRSIDTFRAEGQLPYHKVRAKVILKKSDLDAFMARQRVDARE